MRANQKWSDGQPLTAEDVAYTINRAKKEEWLNYTSVVANLTAKAPRTATLVVHSSVADPKLPTLDMYVLPKHIWEKQDAKAITKYDALDGVGSGPFTLEQSREGPVRALQGQPVLLRRQASGRPRRPAQLRQPRRHGRRAQARRDRRRRGRPGHRLPPAGEGPEHRHGRRATRARWTSSRSTAATDLKKPHPALADLRVRQAIAHAIDKKTIVNRVLAGIGTPTDSLSVSPDTAWAPKIPDGQRYDFDSTRPSRSSIRRATRTPTATASARCPAAGGR